MTGKVLRQSQGNEKYIATLKIQALLNEGNSPKEVALIWNGSLAGSEKPVEKKGINKYGVHFNTKAYAEGVINNLNNQ